MYEIIISQIRSEDEFLLYKIEGRNLEDDFTTLISLVKNEFLFISHEIKISKDSENGTCKFEIIGLSHPQNINEAEVLAIHDYLDFRLTNRLATTRLDNFFHISKIAFKRENRKMAFTINYPLDQPKYVEIDSINANILNKIGFPEKDIPENYLCSIMRSITDIPVYDIRSPETLFERRSLLRSLRSCQTRQNPFTRRKMELEVIRIDWPKRDVILTFIDKAKYLKSRNIPFVNHMSGLTNDQISFEEFAEKFVDSKTEDYLEYNRSGIGHYQNHRYLSAIYCFEKALGICKQQKEPYSGLLNNLGSTYMRCKNWDKALPLLLELTQLEKDPSKLISYKLKLTEVYLAKKEFDKARELLESDLTTLLNNLSSNDRSYQDKKSKYEKLSLLAKYMVTDTYQGQCQGLKTAAIQDQENDLLKFIDFFPDISIDKENKDSLAALHLAIDNNKVKNALILLLNNISLDIQDESKKTALEKLQNHRNPDMQKILLPNLSVKLKPLKDSVPEILKDADLNRLKQKLGLSEDVKLIYFPINRTFIILPCQFNPSIIEFERTRNTLVGQIDDGLTEFGWTIHEARYSPGYSTNVLPLCDIVFTFQLRRGKEQEFNRLLQQPSDAYFSKYMLFRQNKIYEITSPFCGYFTVLALKLLAIKQNCEPGFFLNTHNSFTITFENCEQSIGFHEFYRIFANVFLNNFTNVLPNNVKLSNYFECTSVGMTQSNLQAENHNVPTLN